MSNVLQTGTEGTPSERRVHARQHLGALAYLDIGSDNGGIVVNIGEGGMRVQAVSPLENHSDLKVRVQLPGCPVRIDTDARVVWVGKGGKQAGLHFTGLSEDSRGAILEWIRSAELPIPRTGEQLIENNQMATPHAAIPADASPQPEQLSSSDRAASKWRSLMRDLQGAASSAESIAIGRSGVPASPLDESQSVGEPRKPQIVSRLSERVNQPAAVPPQIVPTVPSASAHPPSSLKLQQESHRPQDQAIRKLAGDLAKRPFEPLPPSGPGAASASAGIAAAAGEVGTPAPPLAKSKSEVTAGSSPPLLASQVAAYKPRTNYSAVTVLVISLAVISFAVGRWIGLADRPIGIEKATSAPSSTTSGPNAITATSTTPNSVQQTTPGMEPQSQTTRLAQQSTKAIRRREKLNAPSDSAGMANVKIPALPKESPTTPLVSKPFDNSPTPNLSTATHSATDSPAPVVIDGHVLRPTDRFNPCHLVYRVEPVYPPDAEREQIQGAVKIHQVIGPDGNVESVRLVSGPSLLAPAALDAAKYWRYFPALLNGQPVATEQDVEIDFRLPQ